jgi:hypothetical protein
MLDDTSSTWKLAAAVSAACLSGALVGLAYNGAKSKNSQVALKKWIRVGTVKELNVYPIKSCKAVKVKEGVATPIGLKAADFLRDRIFMVVDSRYVFQTQRTIPRMTFIEVSVNGNQMTLKAQGMGNVTFDIPDDQPALRKSCRIFDDHVKVALDCGDEVGKWLDTFLDKSGFRLMYHFLDKTQREMTPLQKKFPDFVGFDKGAFQDQTSYMLMAEASVEALNKELDSPVTHRNFRPTIFINETPEPFAEDYWSYVRIGREGGPIFKAAKPCTRCKLTTVNPDTGEFSEQGEPLKTLTTIKRKYGNETVDKLVDKQGVLGLQLGLYSEGNPIKVGDAVYAAAL